MDIGLEVMGPIISSSSEVSVIEKGAEEVHENDKMPCRSKNPKNPKSEES